MEKVEKRLKEELSDWGHKTIPNMSSVTHEWWGLDNYYSCFGSSPHLIPFFLIFLFGVAYKQTLILSLVS